MHCSRSVCRNPNVVRVVRGPPPHARHASFFPTPFFPRAFAAQNDFAPLFRLFDDITTGPVAPQFNKSARAFQPRFDVSEVGDNYELRGELPGIEGKDIEVEFTDPQTLVIRGKTEKETSSGTPPAAANAEAEATKAAADAAAADNSDAASTYSTGSYQKASVEDEAAAESSSAAAEATESAEAKTEPQVEKAAEEQQQQPSTRYWVSERSTGAFQRVFSFPSRIDQEAVKASLKNGILSIVVPKAAEPPAKKITVE